MAERIWGNWQTAGVKVTTTGNSKPKNETEALAQIVAALGADGATIATAANPVPVSGSSTPATFGTGTATQTAASLTAVPVLAANTARKGASIYYDGAAILYLIASATTPTSGVYTIKMGQGYFNYYEVPPGYTGIVQGIWSAATGAAAVTEWTA